MAGQPGKRVAGALFALWLLGLAALGAMPSPAHDWPARPGAGLVVPSALVVYQDLDGARTVFLRGRAG
ncbi:MAG: hypothetical protein FJX68_12330 [Alphaproteobacteria bacterium]|nr:hypothetical protein [Alphaproteobacteria bacterium]